MKLKEEPLLKWQKENNIPYGIVGIMRDEGGRRFGAQCLAFSGKKLKNFQPLVPVTKEWEDWFISEYNIQICDIYKPPYNFDRTGCKGCPFALHLQDELNILEKFFPSERKQCEIIWKPVYDEYRRIGYRLKDNYTDESFEQLSLFDKEKKE
jgi:3'-phosphoadenosine 5'-phosphosulfate sulfotransferase (PAPS reductase)/FAD synthetase